MQVALAGDWVVENASGLMWFEDTTPRHLAIDLNDRPCAAFGGDNLYYSHFNGAIWEVQTADESRGVGAFASLALWGGRYPRIAYFDGLNLDLKYASWKQVGGVWAWRVERVLSSGQVGEGCALALDGSGYAHIVCDDQTTNTVKYVRQTAAGWQSPQATGLAADPSTLNSLVLDEHGEPQVVSRGPGSLVSYAWHDGTGWHTATLSSVAGNRAAPGLAIRNGFLHCSFIEAGSMPNPQKVRYVAFAVGFPGVFLEDAIVKSGPQGGGQASLSLVLGGEIPQLACTLPNDSNVYHLVRVGPTTWSEVALPTGTGAQPGGVSLALNSAGRPFVHYLADEGILTMTCRERLNATTWAAAVGYAHGYGASEHADLAVLGDGSAAVAYHNPQLQGLVFRQRTSFGWVPYGDPDLVGDPGGWVSIAKANEHPLEFHVACHVGDTGDLRYQRWHGYAAAGPVTLDSAGDVGRHASLAVHPIGGLPAVSYYDAGNGHLKFTAQTRMPGGTLMWGPPATIDPADSTGEYCALAYDSAGNPWVGYRRATGSVSEVRAVTRSGGIWAAPVVVLSSAGLDPEHISIALDSGDLPHLAFIDAGDDSLWHLWKMEDGNWDWERVAPTAGLYAIGHTAILLDGLDTPHILLMDYATSTIKVARRSGPGTWILDTVAAVGDPFDNVSRAVTLVRGSNGRPMACWYDSLLRDVMVAWKQQPHIFSIEEVAADTYQLEWTGEGTGVWIDRSPDLGPGSWTSAAGPVTGYSHILGDTAGRMFYRLRAE